MALSKFFTLAEMSRSDTATRLGISNQPTPEAEGNLKTLCTAVLDPLREATGAAINISSGYRGPELNARIGGAKKSQHMEGKAADIQSRGMPVLELFKTVIRLKLPYDQVIYEAKSRTSKWVHVSHDPARARGAILVADFGPEGKVLQYRTITAQQALEITEPATRSLAAEELQYEEMADEPEAFGADATVDVGEARAARRVATPRMTRPAAKAKTRAKASSRAGVKKRVAAKRKPAANARRTNKARAKTTRSAKTATRKTASRLRSKRGKR